VRNVLVALTNARVAADGAGCGGTVYQDFVHFDTKEMYRMFGLMFINGLSPKSSIDLWFNTQAENHIYGNDAVAKAMDKHVDGKLCEVSRRFL